MCTLYICTFRYIDTPGLSDVMQRQQAADEITKALKQNGNYRLVFVCTVESGRVRPDDVTTIMTVLDAINDVTFPYGIVINKVTDKFAAKYNSNKDVQQTVRASLNCGHCPTEQIFLYPFNEALDDRDNEVVQSNPDFLQFLNDLPTKLLRAEQVKNLEIDYFEAKKQEMELQLSKLRSEVERMDAMKAKRQKRKLLLKALFGVSIAIVGIAVYCLL